MIDWRGGVLGPVFAYEWLTSTRRWQGFALRSLFVGCLLSALFAIWWSKRHDQYQETFQALAALGQSFYIAVIGTQLTLVMLAAPAATAGAICLDRARGTLTHLLVTDLTDREIVCGKLAARLVPVLGLVACALPVMALLALLGGVDLGALFGAFLVTIGTAVLGCCLALMFSLWAGKTHEALLGTYAVWALWMLANTMLHALNRTFALDLPVPFEAAPPFTLIFAPYWWPNTVTMTDFLVFFGVTLAISFLLTVLATCRMRAICTRENVRTRRSLFERFGGLGARLDRLNAWRRRLPSPSLDWNPVLWREWHRARPSRAARMVGVIYAALAIVFSVVACLSTGASATSAWVNGLQVSVGLLLLSVSAATSLAEERVRGSLDVLMATPLSTREIVIGKWLGSFRLVPALAVLPGIVVYLSAESGKGNWAMVTTVLYILCCGAAVTSVGLAFATWFSRLGRALAMTITVYVGLTVGWLFLAMLFAYGGARGDGTMMLSPFFGPGEIAFISSTPRQGVWGVQMAWGIFWSLCYAGAAGLFLVATLSTFNRCLGRVEEGSRYHPPEPRLVPLPSKPKSVEEVPAL